MNELWEIDGRIFNVLVLDVDREAAVVDGENAGRLAVSLVMDREVLGTFYNYTFKIAADHMSVSEYDALYEILSAPVESHVVKMPYGQGYITYNAYITGVKDKLLHHRPQFNRWGEMTLQFIAMEPQRRAE